ncbi:type II toxin-antitoxin system YoeB family toxin [Chromatium okenii]|uniref:type II toxin-antitoxin system YoeB family toxin n=1 Tax=Chromatium okenii TaxID=61644 RepID=UPI003083F76A
MREIRFVPDAWDAYLYWQQQDKKTLKRINTLINEAVRTAPKNVRKSVYTQLGHSLSVDRVVTATGVSPGQSQA